MISRSLDASSRYFDSVGRWGGEEFLAVVANVDQKNLGAIAERMRIMVERSMLGDAEQILVTVSIGGAMAVREDSMESLIQRADEKLYQAKKSGKNRVCI
jgi:diguanylate cyclase (GGDEF)-like protein